MRVTNTALAVDSSQKPSERVTLGKESEPELGEQSHAVVVKKNLHLMIKSQQSSISRIKNMQSRRINDVGEKKRSLGPLPLDTRGIRSMRRY